VTEQKSDPPRRVDREPDDSSRDKPGRARKSGIDARDAVMLSAPNIIIVFPLVGFGIGYALAKAFHWPMWIAIITLLMGFIQGIREVIRLGEKMSKR